ncbi:MAG: PorP/SprF family type IX secretion system membrane protein [Bacteroidia bacterium]
MRYFRFISLILFSSLGLKAQQVGAFSHYFYKPLVYNPAFAGSGNSNNATLIHRAQWSDFKYAPQLNMFIIDGIIKEKKVGLGLSVISDKRGINKRTGVNLSYSYRLNFNEETSLSFGLSAGVVDQTIDFSRVAAENYADPTLFYNSQHKAVLDANAGLAFIWNGLELGIAVPQLAGNKINYNEDTSGIKNFYRQSRHIISSIKYKIPVSAEKGISIAPQLLLRIVPGAPVQYDGNLNFEWKDKFWIGGSYKSGYAVAANLGVCLHKQLSVGYSYDIITGKIGAYSGISHEILVNYKFGKGKKEEPEHVEEHPTEEGPKTADNPALERKVDSLHDQLSESERKIKELYSKIDQLAKAQAQSASNNTSNQNAGNQNNGQNTGNQNSGNENPNNQNSGNQNSNNTQNEANVPANGFNGGKDVLVNSRKEYVDAKNETPSKGFYIIVGTFFYRDFAEAEAQRFVKRGYKFTSMIYSNSKKHHFIHSYKLANQKEALAKLKEIRAAGFKDAWIIELTD